jgi:hypothetical protein
MMVDSTNVGVVADDDAATTSSSLCPFVVWSVVNHCGAQSSSKSPNVMRVLSSVGNTHHTVLVEISTISLTCLVDAALAHDVPLMGRQGRC